MSEWRGRRIVVTGGLGFIGSNLALRLAGAGADVTILDLPEPACHGDAANLDGGSETLTIVRADLARPGEWSRCLDGAEFVFHLAAQVSHAASMSTPLTDLEQNYCSLLNVLEAARRQDIPPRVVFTSTRQVYGRAESLPIRESHPLRPTDLNGVHKLAAEEALRVYRDAFGVPSAVLRLANTYGPRMDLRNPGRGVLNVFVARALRREPIDLFGDGSQRRDIHFVDDVVDALLLLARSTQTATFHLGSHEACRLSTFLEALDRIIPLTIRHRAFPSDARAIDIGDSHCDPTEFHEATGWSPRIGLDEGLARTIRWARGRLASLSAKGVAG